MPRRLQLTVRGRVVAFLGSLAITAAGLTGDPHAALAASLLLAPVLVDWLWKSWRAPGIAIEVRERRSCVGASFLEELICRNTSAVRALHCVRLSEVRTAVRGGGTWIEHLAPQQSLVVRVAARARTRGILLCRVFSVQSSYPMGFVRAHSVVTVSSRLVVEPSRVRPPDECLRNVRAQLTETLASQRRGIGDFHSLREHHAGEDVRGVHALRSAATGVLVRRVMHADADGEIRLVLDLRQARCDQPVQRRSLERGLGMAAAWVDEASGRGAVLRCLVLDKRPRIHAVGDASSATALLDHLSAAAAAPPASVPEQLLQELRTGPCLWIMAGGARPSGATSPQAGIVLVDPQVS